MLSKKANGKCCLWLVVVYSPHCNPASFQCLLEGIQICRVHETVKENEVIAMAEDKLGNKCTEGEVVIRLEL